MSESNVIRLIILGEGDVGKSTITVRLVSGCFVPIYDPTLEDSYRTSISVDGEVVSLDILDTAGQEDYLPTRDQYIRISDGYLIVYSITSMTSFFETNEIREQIYGALDKDASEHIPIALVGNKCDLESERQVPTDEAKRLAEEWNVLFFETSAKDNINITETFQALVKDVIAHKAQRSTEQEVTPQQTRRKKCSLF